MKPSLSLLFWPLLFLSQLIATCLLAWHLLAQIDFAYPTGYKLLDLQEHIQEFAPRNKFKHEFEHTTPQEHWEFFAKISEAIQHHGAGLRDISYKLPNGTYTPLMHEAEIIHLQDVANLIDIFYKVGLTAWCIWILLFVVARVKKLSLPRVTNIFLGFSIGFFVVIGTIIVLGSTKVFYWFHTKIFPDGHQWFFYYEDSLMTTLMKAPDIFAFIAVLFLGIFIILWGASTFSMALLLKKQHHPLPKENKKRVRKK